MSTITGAVETKSITKMTRMEKIKEIRKALSKLDDKAIDHVHCTVEIAFNHDMILPPKKRAKRKILEN